jgi:ATP-dependent 26S proteasome regulatory subunit
MRLLHEQVARCTKIINPNTEEAKYVINVKQIAKFVVGLGEKVAPTDIEEGMRVGVDRQKYQVGLIAVTTPCRSLSALQLHQCYQHVVSIAALAL